MFTRKTTCLLIAAAAFTAAAEPPREDVAEANDLLAQGKIDDAIQAYRNLQIDDPESDLLYYNIGCAQLEDADTTAADDSPAAIASLNAAKTAFDKAAMAEEANIRRDARYNRINCDSLLAKQLAETGDYDGAIKAFESAIYGYEDFLDQYPNHAGAQKNLNHMRYLLKKMLQDPPEQQEQQDQQDPPEGEGEKNQDGDQQDQQDQQDKSGDQEQGDQPEPSDEQGAQKNEDQQQPGEQPNPEKGAGEDQQKQAGEDQSDEGEPGNESGGQEQKPGEGQSSKDGTPGEEPVQLPSKDTIEAILDALQERDKDEQQNMRRVPQNPRRSGPWW